MVEAMVKIKTHSKDKPRQAQDSDVFQQEKRRRFQRLKTVLPEGRLAKNLEMCTSHNFKTLKRTTAEPARTLPRSGRIPHQERHSPEKGGVAGSLYDTA